MVVARLGTQRATAARCRPGFNSVWSIIPARSAATRGVPRRAQAIRASLHHRGSRGSCLRVRPSHVAASAARRAVHRYAAITRG